MLLRLLKGRLALQLLLLTLAVLVVIHGLAGPQVAPRNMATVLTWVHYRGLLVIALLAIGNLFCASCPMILVRDTGRRLWHPALRWPRRLRGKWLGLILLIAVLFAYELYDLWELPRATAWLIVGYFAAALGVDVLFSGASFCKHLCPIGQFNFVASTMSPLELQARNLNTCGSCATVDCIRGRTEHSDRSGRSGRSERSGRPERFERSALSEHPINIEWTPLFDHPERIERSERIERFEQPERSERPERAEPSWPSGASGRLRVLRGCELALFMPAKVGNLDCTLCGDCVRACPHDNIAMVARVPGAELLDTRWRSGIGRLASRRDLAALFGVFTVAGLLNAFAMTDAGVSLGWVTLTLLFAAALLVPLALALLPGRLFRQDSIAFIYALAPLGVGIWSAHYLFHFLTGALTVVPVVQAATADALGTAALGEPAWRLVGMAPGSVFPIQLGFLILGAVGSLGLVQAIARRDSPARAWSVSLPWLLAVIGMTAAAAWTLAQPMAMRGVR